MGLRAERPKGGDGEGDEAESRGGAAGGGGEVNVGPMTLEAAMGGEADGVGMVGVNPRAPGRIMHLDIDQGVSAWTVEVTEDQVRLVAKGGET